MLARSASLIVPARFTSVTRAALASALALTLADRPAALERAGRALEGMHRYHPAVVGGGYARLILDAMRGIDFQ